MLRLYISKLPCEMPSVPLGSELRNIEIAAAKNPKTAAQKYHVWKLLECAALHTFGRPLSDFVLTKTENGKWLCDSFFFSLSHTDAALAVAISGRSVGVDIECKRFRAPSRAAKKILTPTELDAYLKAQDKDRFLVSMWTAKESIFKMLGGAVFLPHTINVSDFFVLTDTARVGSENCTFSVAAESAETLEIFKNGEYLESSNCLP